MFKAAFVMACVGFLFNATSAVAGPYEPETFASEFAGGRDARNDFESNYETAKLIVDLILGKLQGDANIIASLDTGERLGDSLQKLLDARALMHSHLDAIITLSGGAPLNDRDHSASFGESVLAIREYNSRYLTPGLKGAVEAIVRASVKHLEAIYALHPEIQIEHHIELLDRG